MKSSFHNSLDFILLNLVEQLPLPLRKMMKWKMSSITPNVVKNTVIRSGFRLISGMLHSNQIFFSFIKTFAFFSFSRW